MSSSQLSPLLRQISSVYTLSAVSKPNNSLAYKQKDTFLLSKKNIKFRDKIS